MHGRKENYIYIVSVGNAEGKKPIRNLSVDGRIILKLMLQKQGPDSTGSG
jgi:hypothetical protein